MLPCLPAGLDSNLHDFVASRVAHSIILRRYLLKIDQKKFSSSIYSFRFVVLRNPNAFGFRSTEKLELISNVVRACSTRSSSSAVSDKARNKSNQFNLIEPHKVLLNNQITQSWSINSDENHQKVNHKMGKREENSEPAQVRAPPHLCRKSRRFKGLPNASNSLQGWTLYLVLCLIVTCSAQFQYGFNIGVTNLPTQVSLKT